LVLNLTIDAGRSVVTGLTANNFDVTLWNSRGQALTKANNVQSVSVVESPDRHGIYFLYIDWHAGNSPKGWPGPQIAWLGLTTGTYTLAIRVHHAEEIGQHLLQFRAEFAEPQDA
jgi:hypothetical protein